MASALVSTPNAQNKTPVTGYPVYNLAVGYPAAIYSTAAASTLRPQYYRNRRAAHFVLSKSFICRLFSAIIMVASVTALAFFLTWLLLRPRLPEFEVVTASVSPLNLTGSRLTATWNFTLLVRNPNNRLSVLYDHLEGSVMYGGDEVVISATQMLPFSQEKKNETKVELRIQAVSAYVGEEVAKRISDGRADGTVRFEVRVFAGVKYMAGRWWTRRHLFRVYCDDVVFGFAFSNGTWGKMLGESRACEVFL